MRGQPNPSWSQQHQFSNCPVVVPVPEQEVTLAKIATLEDDYSKMKRALLSSMDEEEEEMEEEEEKRRRDVRCEPELTNVRASQSSKLAHVNSSSSHSSSRSFNPSEPPSNRDLSSRQAAHGKALIVEISQKKHQATVEYDKLELRGIPPELKHERDVLARASNVDGSEMRERSLVKGRLLEENF